MGLYSHIPHREGLEIMKLYLDKREDQSVASDGLYKLAKIILKYNYFELGQDEYHRVLGTAIDMKFAPHYAKNFIAGLEEEIFSNVKVSTIAMATLFR